MGWSYGVAALPPILIVAALLWSPAVGPGSRAGILPNFPGEPLRPQRAGGAVRTHAPAQVLSGSSG